VGAWSYTLAAVHPVRVSYVYRFVTLSIFQFFYWTISPVMSDCLLQISHGFYYVRVVYPWFITPYLLQSLQFVIATFSVYHLSNYFSTFICRVTRFFKKSLSEIRLTQRYAPDTVRLAFVAPVIYVAFVTSAIAYHFVYSTAFSIFYLPESTQPCKRHCLCVTVLRAYTVAF